MSSSLYSNLETETSSAIKDTFLFFPGLSVFGLLFPKRMSSLWAGWEEAGGGGGVSAGGGTLGRGGGEVISASDLRLISLSLSSSSDLFLSSLWSRG